jgi:short-subunit dehydrogenase
VFVVGPGPHDQESRRFSEKRFDRGPSRPPNGRVVTVASTRGHRAVGDATAHYASKFGVVGFTRALAAETKGRLSVTLVTAGGKRTNFFPGPEARYRPPDELPLADPAALAEAIVLALSRPPGARSRSWWSPAPRSRPGRERSRCCGRRSRAS